jgi:DNA mismatch repair ATPase MutS
VNALTERGIKVFFVTHLYEFARHEFEKNLPNAIFLRAERKQNSERTFKIIEGGPLRTSFGEDVYHSIFNHEI